jgi:hypothetical protein
MTERNVQTGGGAVDCAIDGTNDRFVIHDRATAAWAIGKINAARAELEYRKQAAADWIDEAERELERLEKRFSSEELRRWGEANLPDGKKTLILKTGRLEYRNQPARFVVTDEAKAAAWAKKHLPTAIKVEERLLRSVLIDHAKATPASPPTTARAANKP